MTLKRANNQVRRASIALAVIVAMATVTVSLTEKSLSEGALRGGLPALVVGGAVLAILAYGHRRQPTGQQQRGEP